MLARNVVGCNCHKSEQTPTQLRLNPLVMVKSVSFRDEPIRNKEEIVLYWNKFTIEFVLLLFVYN